MCIRDRPKAKAKSNPTAVGKIREGADYAPVAFNPYMDAATIRRTGDIPTVLTTAQQYDADFSQAIWAVTRFASTDIQLRFMTEKGEFDAEKTKQFRNLLDQAWLSSINEPDTNELADNIIMELFMQGGVGIELVLDKFKIPTRLITVASKEVKWRKKAGGFVPYQTGMGGKETSLDIPTFWFVNTDRRPEQAVADSPLLAAVQAVAFKQAVINDIQRVIRRAGYPRHMVTILEETLKKNAPANVRMDPEEMVKWLNKQKTEIAEALSKLNPEDALVMFDSVNVEYLTTQGSMTVDFRPIVSILDSQLTSALKVLPSILGKLTDGGSQNIASVESMTFVNTLTFLQERCDKILSQAYTFQARLLGMRGYVIAKHDAINLRPQLELEPQKLAKQNRILQLQSFGHITDSEAALMLGILHLPTEELSGKRFLDGGPSVDTENISPNGDPLGRSVTGGDGAGDTRGNSSSS